MDPVSVALQVAGDQGACVAGGPVWLNAVLNTVQVIALAAVSAQVRRNHDGGYHTSDVKSDGRRG